MPRWISVDNVVFFVGLCGDLPRIELFARQTAEGWDSWGNEVDNNNKFLFQGEEKDA